MTEISRSALFGKLNPLAYKAIESATVFCKLRGNPYVELVHWLHQILQLPDSDLNRIIQHFELNTNALAQDVIRSLDQLPQGASSISDLSAHIEEAVEQAWLYASLMFNEAQIRTAYLIIGLLKTRSLRHALYSISEQFKKINIDQLTDQLSTIIAGSPEDHLKPQDGSQLASPGEASQALPASTEQGQALLQFTTDLTARAEAGELDPVVGRDHEIRQIVDILMRRRQNNPILTGEAGVGKTAVVEGFAQRIVRGDVPPSLQGVRVHVLDLSRLQAGASMKGEFENRLKQVIEAVQSSEKPIILFIDEAHTLIGAGGTAGTGDAANLLKPALARGTLRTIAATTWIEYKKYIEKDPALSRRFQRVKVDEPDEQKAVLMLRGLASAMEKHHQVVLLDDALESAVKLSHRYIPDRQLPDKAISVLDTACARVAISQHAWPPPLEELQRRLESLQVEQNILDREAELGMMHPQRQAAIQSEREQLEQQKAALEQDWQAQKSLVKKILNIRDELRQASLDDASAILSEEEKAERLTQLKHWQDELAAMQGDHPLVFPTVDEQVVAAVIADWTGIPVGRMVKNEIEAVLNLSQTLNQRVIGQQHALDMIARRIQTSRAHLDDPNKPIGVFLLVGPSGVGKTETGLALAEALYGGEHNIITLNMSEFQEAHTVSTLKGSPPGYVGYGEGGLLTEAVRRRPYSVVLLDEIEKAHPDVHEIFFQVFDKGWMEDAEGRYIDFRNTVILLTSNVGTDRILSLCQDPELMPEPDSLAEAVRQPLLQVFPPALLGRLVVIPYYPLNDEQLKQIIQLQLARIQKRIQAQDLILEYDESVVDLILKRCTEVDSGARIIDAILTNTLLPEISYAYLSHLLTEKSIHRIQVTVQDDQFQYRFEEA